MKVRDLLANGLRPSSEAVRQLRRSRLCWSGTTRITLAALLLLARCQLAQGDDDTWRVIKASLADRVQRIRHVVVKSRERTDVLNEASGLHPTPEGRREWGWSQGKEFSHHLDRIISPNETPPPTIGWNIKDETGWNWAYDGHRILLYSTDKEDRILHVSIVNEPPDVSRLQTPEPPNLLGMRVRWMTDDLAKLAQRSEAQFQESIDVEGRKLPGFKLTAPGVSGSPITIIAAFDPAADWSPAMIESKIADSTGKADVRSILVVTATMAVPDGDGPETLTVAKTAHRTINSARHGDELLTTIDLNEVQINVPIDPALFAPVIPDGIPVDEPPSRPGGFPRTYISGGKEAEQQVLAVRTSEIAAERQRLLQQHGTLDATPSSTSSLQRWAIAIGIGLLLGATGVFVFRRAV